MENQDDLINAWAKMELNSIYGFPQSHNDLIIYYKNKADQITKAGNEYLDLIQENLKNNDII